MKTDSYIKAVLFLLLFTGIVPALGFEQSAKAQKQAERIEDLLTKYHEYGLFNGSVLVAKGGEVLYKGGFGEANRNWDIPNKADTKFRIGSTTKQFTAAVILALAEDGKLDLDGTVNDYLPDYPEKQGNQITIHHLLTHSSGIPSYTTPAFMSDEVRDPTPPDSLIALFSGLELQFEPGTHWSYSNSGYVLLGAIIEAVTGKPYQQVLRELILEPAGLDQTGYDQYNQVLKHRASGYVSTPGGFQRAPYLDSSVPYSAGMLYSTVEDLFKWDQQLYEQGPFTQEETKKLMFQSHIPLPERLIKQAGLPPYYGYGWFVGKVPVNGDSVQITEHGGSIFGFSSGFWRMPDEKNTVILLDNSSSGKVRDLGKGLIAILYGHTPEEPKQPISRVLYEIIESKGLETAASRFKELRKEKSKTYNFEESELNRLGYYYLNDGQTDRAITVFNLNTEAYPKSANAYDSLGEALLKAGQYEKARDNYQKSLELNPNNSNARQMLERIRIQKEKNK